MSGTSALRCPALLQPEPLYLLIRVAVCGCPGQGAAHADQATAQQQQEAKYALQVSHEPAEPL